MVVEVPDEATLIATILAGLIPKEVLNASVQLERHPEGLRLQPSVPLKASARKKLAAAGVATSSARLKKKGIEFASWLETIACQPRTEDGADRTVPEGEVLFLVGPDHPLMPLCAELLRLGCPTQHIGPQLDADGRPIALLRVTAPPYFVVLRAFEETADLSVFTSMDGHVWTQLGFVHPLDPRLPPGSDGQLVLIPAEGPWITTSDGPWIPLERHLHIEVPAERRLEPRPLEDVLRVPLRLEPSSRATDARLWLLEGDGQAQLERLLNAWPSSVVEALQFARFDDGGRMVFALRSPQLGQPPPALELDALALAPRPELPNLYLPLGTRLAPPLALEQVRARLAPDPDQLVWLESGPPLVRREVPESVFVPLVDWADYVIDQASEPLLAWIASATFDFEAYRVAAVPSEPAPTSVKTAVRREALPSTPTLAQPATSARRATPNPASTPTEWARVEAAPDAAAEALARMEGHLATLPRSDLTTEHWLALARHATAARRDRDAALAFVRAAWTSSDAGAVYAEWSSTFALAGPLPDALSASTRGEGGPGPLRVAAHLMAEVNMVEPLTAQTWLGQHEASLPVHLAWLARTAAAELAGGDALGLLRTRDLITRQIENGLSLARDVPSFVRRMGTGRDTPAAAFLQEQLEQLWARYRTIERRRSSMEAPEPLTRAYVGLIVRWGYARLGLKSELPEHEIGTLDRNDEVHAILLDLFGARIQQAQEGADTGTPLPVALTDRLRQLPQFPKYKVERLSHESLILGGSGLGDPFQRYAKATSTVVPLPDTAAGRTSRLRSLLESSVDSDRAQEVVALISGLPESQTVPLFSPTLAWMAQLPPNDRSAAFEALTFLAGHLDRADLVQRCLDAWLDELDATPKTAFGAYGRIARIVSRSGLAERIHDRVVALADHLEGDDVSQAEDRLSVATALVALGDPSTLSTAIRQALDIINREMRTDQHLRLVRAICLALARTSAEEAAGGVETLLPRLAFVTDQLSSNSHYCLSVLRFMESMVLALTGRDLTLGPEAVRWLDTDESELRSRIHRDLQRLHS